MTAAMSLVTFPVLAQTTTTTVTTDPPAPPPPSASTQVVVNPPASQPPPPPLVVQPDPAPVVVRDDSLSLEARPSGRSAIRTIALDSLYGGIAGGAVGGGVTLIDQGNHWQRDLMVGAGIGVLVGAGYGIFESATQPAPARAVADRDEAASDAIGVAPVQYATRF